LIGTVCGSQTVLSFCLPIPDVCFNISTFLKRQYAGVFMDKQQMIEKATEVLRPFETENLMTAMQTMTLKQIFSNPVVLAIVAVLLFFGIIKKSKTVLLTLFAMIGLIVMIRYAIPPVSTAENVESSMSSLGPFIFGGITIGGVIIYFTMIKSD
jgi:hypothetical protein